MNILLSALARDLERLANPERAQAMSAYMRNQFPFYGIPMAKRRQCCLAKIRAHKPPYAGLDALTRACWRRPQREWQYAGIDLVAACIKEWQKDLIHLIRYLLTEKSWWDTVDNINADLAGPYFLLFPDRMAAVTGEWNRSDNIWLQRSSLIFQKKYREKTNLSLLAKYITRLSGSKEFFVQKGIGWALREYAKTDPRWVKDFVKKHKLAPLSKKEALRGII